MEIESPGRLPHPVTLENMRKTRCSRNPLITRVLTELKWLRELNEGVPRIYADMEGAFLDDSEFTEGAASFKLILKNNIHTRRMRREDSVAKSVGDDVWNILDDVEKDILVYLAGRRNVMARELAGALKLSRDTIGRRLQKLLQLKVAVSRGPATSPRRTYNLAVLD